MSLLTQNITATGRWLRAVGGLLLLLAAFLAWSHSHPLAVAFTFAGTFILFEAARGWCAFRACGIKTPF